MKTKILTCMSMAILILFSERVNAQKPSAALLNPSNHVLTLIDHEGQMIFPVKSIGITELRNNVALIAGASKIFNVPTVVTTVSEEHFAGPVIPEVELFYPKATSNYIDRTSMNSWEDVNYYKVITSKAKKKIVFAGLWTSVCIVGPALSALAEGYEVYVITDACGDVSSEAHNMAIQRMVEAGAKPMTALQYLLELQRDWARQATYDATLNLVKKYAGAYGIGVQYANAMVKP
jgi:nicotinamidase-related amidase